MSDQRKAVAALDVKARGGDQRRNGAVLGGVIQAQMSLGLGEATGSIEGAARRITGMVGTALSSSCAEVGGADGRVGSGHDVEG